MSETYNSTPKKPMTYKDSGVDIDAGDQLVQKIKRIAKATYRPGVKNDLGGFNALFEIPSSYKEPLLVSGTDGVGTKLKLAIDFDRHESIGIDLVAMCVNDLLVCGAEPLFFLDYYASGKLSVDVAEKVITGIGEGCLQAGCALIGGETAEMPGMYSGKDYDLAGFCVGVVEKKQVIDGTRIQAGDQLIGIASSGAHSNGYALIRKILSVTNTDPQSFQLGEKSLLEHLMVPTKIYVKSIQRILGYDIDQVSNSKKPIDIKGMVHITGGGLTENIPRVLPQHCLALIHRDSWSLPPIFQWIKNQGQIDDHEFFRVLNCGIGFILVVPPVNVETTLSVLSSMNESAWVIGEIAERHPDQNAVIYQ